MREPATLAPMALAVGLALASMTAQGAVIQSGAVSPAVTGGTATGQVNIGTGDTGTVTVNGGSTLRVVRGGTPTQQARIHLGNGTPALANGSLVVQSGGRVIVDGSSEGAVSGGRVPGVIVGTNGRGTVSVSGAGSALVVQGNTGFVNVGELAGSSGSLSVTAGGYVGGRNTAGNRDLTFVNVGRNGSTGQPTSASLLVDGAGSQVRLSGVGATGSGGNNPGAGASLMVGRDGATGTATISGGARVTLDNGGLAMAPGRSVTLTSGFQGGGSGSIVIRGTGSELTMTNTSTANYVGIGRAATGSISIEAGGLLRITGNAGSTDFNQVDVGGTLANAGGSGALTISGAGSRLIMDGSTERVVRVGSGAGGVGTLRVENGGRLETSLLQIGRVGGTGTLVMDGGRIDLSGASRSAGTGGLTVAGGTGATGTVDMRGGSVLRTDGATGPTGVLIGGSTALNAGGTGSVSVSGGSRMELVNGANLTVGREGRGTLNVEAGSTVSMSGGGNIGVGTTAQGSGTMNLAGTVTVIGGAINLGWANGASTGAPAVMTMNGGTASADTLRLGAGGVLAGNGTVVADVINGGTLTPGFSPGRLVIDGGYQDDGGRIVLEVQGTAGGFLTDQLVFRGGAPLDFDGSDIEFRFLGGTDPLAFRDGGGFVIDSFFRVQDLDGTERGLSSLLTAGQSLDGFFEGAAFTALGGGITAFRFGAAAGVLELLMGAPGGDVPLPGTLVLLLAGGGVLWVRRRQRLTNYGDPV